MTHTQATVWVAMSIVVAFAFGTILWVREGQLDRVSEELDATARTVVLLEGRLNALADYLGVDIHDPVPDGPDEYVPDEVSAPRERDLVDLERTEDAIGNEPYDSNPVTEPIPVVDPMGPATVPDMKAAAKVAPLPVVDVEWEQRRAAIEADWQRRVAEIGEAK